MHLSFNMSNATDTSSGARQPLLAGKSIIIAGAGVGGLAFAIALSKQWPYGAATKPKVTIYERDSYDDRVGREGYTLSVRSDRRSGGIQVLDKLGLYEKIREVSVTGYREGGGAFVLWDRNWNDLLKVKVDSAGPKALHSMRIRRNALQKVLADGAVDCGADIRWSTQVVDAERLEGGGMRVNLKDGTTADCDILIAADGSKSAIRRCLRPDDGLDFAGVVGMMGTARFETEEQVPKPLDKDWGLILGGNGKGVGLFASPVDSHSALWSLSYCCKEPRKQVKYPIPEAELTALMDEARELAKDFPPKLHDLMSATDPTTFRWFNAMDRPAFRHTVDQHGPVVWIGDANHAVSPFAGNGANMALMDAWDLARCLGQAASLEEGLQEYDQAAVPRALATLKMSRFNITMFHATGWRLAFYTICAKLISFFAIRIW